MSTPQPSVALEPKLRDIVGAEYVHAAPSVTLNGDKALFKVSPENVDEVAALLRLASGHGLVVVPVGSGSQQVSEPFDLLLDLSRLNRVLHYDPGDLTIGLEAGFRIADLESLLSPNRQMLPLDGPRTSHATVGGMMATGRRGPLAHAFGGAREFCLGISLVTADGKIAKAGGRVVKNVAGYDLMKLMIGSFGTLAVITSANFRLFPMPRQTRTFIAGFASAKEACSFRDHAIRSPLEPLCLEIVSPEAARVLELEPAGCWLILVRAAGSDTVLKRYRSVLGCEIAGEVSGSHELDLWRATADFPTADRSGDIVLEVAVPPSAVNDLLRVCEEAGQKYGFAFAAAGRAVGPLTTVFSPLAGIDFVLASCASLIAEVRLAIPRDGWAVVVRCPDKAKTEIPVWGNFPTDLEAMRMVKRAMDPKCILNRGRLPL